MEQHGLNAIGTKGVKLEDKFLFHVFAAFRKSPCVFETGLEASLSFILRCSVVRTIT